MSPFIKKSLASFALLCVAAGPSFAASSTASSASDSVATSVGSVSGSFQKSSNSSSTTTPLAGGDYTITEVAVLPERPGTLRLTLQALADPSAEGEYFLYLPQAAFDPSQLATGRTVTALARPYGLEFTHGDTRQAFFLVLTDDWYRALQTRPVVL